MSTPNSSPNQIPSGAAAGAMTAGGPRGVAKALAFILEGRGTAALTQRAADALGLLPTVRWTKLDSPWTSDADALTIELYERGPCLTVALDDPDDDLATLEICALLGVIAGLTQREHQLEQFSAQARTDVLTGLWNRRAFDEMLAQGLSRAARSGENVTMLLIDIDRFKQINDRLGHDAGDRALVAVAEAIRSVTRPSDVAARLGGDEIAILLAGCDADGGRIVAERLQRAVADLAPDFELPLTLSIGVADVEMLIEPGPNANCRTTLMHLADEALYMGKRAGRNAVTVHPGLDVVILHAA